MPYEQPFQALAWFGDLRLKLLSIASIRIQRSNAGAAIAWSHPTALHDTLMGEMVDSVQGVESLVF